MAKHVPSWAAEVEREQSPRLWATGHLALQDEKMGWNQLWKNTSSTNSEIRRPGLNGHMSSINGFAFHLS